MRLELQPADWFELLDEPVKEVSVGANDIQVVYFRVRAMNFGLQPFQVTAWGSQLSDAILKRVQVYPDGSMMTYSHSDYLLPDQPVTLPVSYRDETIVGTQTLLVKMT